MIFADLDRTGTPGNDTAFSVEVRLIIEKRSTDFTVQEVVDRSVSRCGVSTNQFDGKHEVLLALFEDALSRSADQIRAATDGTGRRGRRVAPGRRSPPDGGHDDADRHVHCAVQ
jgi:hypothetical protein